MEQLDWMEQRIERLPKQNWFYRFVCLFLFRPRKKLTFKEMYLITSRLNEKRMGLELARQWAFLNILTIYKFQYGNLPDSVDTNALKQEIEKTINKNGV